VLVCDTYEATNLPVTVSYSTNNFVRWSVPDVGAVTSLTLTMAMTHTDLSTIDAELSNETNAGPLWSIDDMAGNTMTGTVLTDNAAGFLSAGTEPYTGEYKPTLPFTTRFATSQINGNWTMFVNNPDVGEEGIVSAASLEICYYDRPWIGTSTPTLTPTRTPVTTATSGPTATPGPCSDLPITIDGDLADWVAIATPMYLNAGNAAYLMPAATPSAADLSGAFWISCDDAYIIVAGLITDTVVTNPPGSLLTVGDAAHMLFDGRADGIVRPGQDDHDVFVDPRGRHVDYNRPVPGVTVAARTTPASNWRYEIAIPIHRLYAGLVAGSVLGYTFGIHDNDGTATPGPDRVMIGPYQQVILPTASP
jgi:hypothetical protein